RILLTLDAFDRDFRALAYEVEQADADVAREAFADDFHRRHAAADDPLLVGQVVVADAAFDLLFRLELLALAGDALQEGIDFVLRKNLLIHGASCRSGRACGLLDGEAGELHRADARVVGLGLLVLLLFLGRRGGRGRAV